MRNSRKVKQKLKMVMCVPSSCYGKLKNMLRNVSFFQLVAVLYRVTTAPLACQN